MTCGRKLRGNAVDRTTSSTPPDQAAASPGNSKPIPVDSAITKHNQDLLGRGNFVDGIVATLQRLKPSDGVVVALYGPWGAGKTSVLNLVRERLKVKSDTTPIVNVMDFNPWLIADNTALVHLFLDNLGEFLGQTNGRRWRMRVRRLLRQYAGLVQPLATVPKLGWVAAIVATVSRLRRDQPVEDIRDKLIKKLENHQGRLVVILDDLDRLQPDELLATFRLVRLVANFPNVIYLLAFDDAQVARTLDEALSPRSPPQEASGRRYLEKIVQYVFTLPQIPATVLKRQLDNAVSYAYSLVEPSSESSPRYVGNESQELIYAHYDWPAQHGKDILNALSPLFRTLRDMNRVQSVLPNTFIKLGQEVSFANLVALESLRILEPKLFDALAAQPDLADPENTEASTADGKQFEEILTTAQESRREALRTLLKCLFPASTVSDPDYSQHAEWRYEGRVAVRSVLDYYFRQGMDDNFADIRLVTESVASKQQPYAPQGLAPATYADLALRLAGLAYNSTANVLEPNNKLRSGHVSTHASNPTVGVYSVPSLLRTAAALLELQDRAGRNNRTIFCLAKACLSQLASGTSPQDQGSSSVHEAPMIFDPLELSDSNSPPSYGELALFRGLLADKTWWISEYPDVHKWLEAAWQRTAKRIRAMKPDELRSNFVLRPTDLLHLTWALEPDPSDRGNIDEAISSPTNIMTLFGILLRSTGDDRPWDMLAEVCGGEDRLEYLAKKFHRVIHSADPLLPALDALDSYLRRRCFDPFTQKIPDEQSIKGNSIDNSSAANNHYPFHLGLRIDAFYDSQTPDVNRGTLDEDKLRTRLFDNVQSSRWVDTVSGVAKTLGLREREESFALSPNASPVAIEILNSFEGFATKLETRFSYRTQAAGSNASLFQVDILVHLDADGSNQQAERRFLLPTIRDLLAAGINLVAAERPDKTIPSSDPTCPVEHLEIRVAPLGTPQGPPLKLQNVVDIDKFRGSDYNNQAEWVAVLQNAPIRSYGDARRFATFALRIMMSNAHYSYYISVLRDYLNNDRVP